MNAPTPQSVQVILHEGHPPQTEPLTQTELHHPFARALHSHIAGFSGFGIVVITALAPLVVLLSNGDFVNTLLFGGGVDRLAAYHKMVTVTIVALVGAIGGGFMANTGKGILSPRSADDTIIPPPLPAVEGIEGVPPLP